MDGIVMPRGSIGIAASPGIAARSASRIAETVFTADTMQAHRSYSDVS